VGQLQVEREGSFEVGKRLGHERDAVVALRAQALEFEFGDHGVGFSIGQSTLSAAGNLIRKWPRVD
jgi:hypothetical protein